jgi:hypothetical protein
VGNKRAVKVPALVFNIVVMNQQITYLNTVYFKKKKNLGEEQFV